MTGASTLRVFEPAVQEGFEWALPVDNDHHELFLQLAGTHHAATWTPVEMRLIHEDTGERFRRADLPWLGSHVLILRDEAIDVVGPVLEPYGELLPLACLEARLAVFNATRVLDALDEQRSDLVRFGSGRIMKINTAAFRPELLDGPQVFKIPQMLRGPAFFTTEVVERIRATGRCTGVTFREVPRPHE